jgi:hypothetical protein
MRNFIFLIICKFCNKNSFLKCEEALLEEEKGKKSEFLIKYRYEQSFNCFIKLRPFHSQRLAEYPFPDQFLHTNPTTLSLLNQQ